MCALHALLHVSYQFGLMVSSYIRRASCDLQTNEHNANPDEEKQYARVPTGKKRTVGMPG